METSITQVAATSRKGGIFFLFSVGWIFNENSIAPLLYEVLYTMSEDKKKMKAARAVKECLRKALAYMGFVRREEEQHRANAASVH